MATTVHKSGPVTVTIRDDFFDKAPVIVERFEARMEQEMRNVVETARPQWPVDTGRSSKNLKYATIRYIRETRFTIYDTVWYTEYVRDRGQPIGESWRSLIVVPVERLRGRMGVILQEVVRMGIDG